MEAILSGVSLVFQQATTWVGEIIDIIVGQPLLILLVVAMPVIGFGVGLLKRIMRG